MRLHALSEGDVLQCPACGETWEGFVEDYVVPNRTGIDSEAIEECVECSASIRVVRDPDGSFYAAEDDE